MGANKQWGRVIGMAVVGGLFAVVLLATPAAAAIASVSVSPAIVTAGGAVRVSGSVSPSACALSDGVILTSTTALFPRAGFGPVATRTASGVFAISYSVPAATPPGTYSIGLRCGGGNLGVSATLRVIAQVSEVPVRAPQAGFGGASAVDGHAAGWAAAGAVALVVAGLLMLITVLRRDSTG